MDGGEEKERRRRGNGDGVPVSPQRMEGEHRGERSRANSWVEVFPAEDPCWRRNHRGEELRLVRLKLKIRQDHCEREEGDEEERKRWGERRLVLPFIEAEEGRGRRSTAWVHG